MRTMPIFPIAINLKPYEGLKPQGLNESQVGRITNIAINLKPYEGLKQTIVTYSC